MCPAGFQVWSLDPYIDEEDRKQNLCNAKKIPNRITGQNTQKYNKNMNWSTGRRGIHSIS